MVGEPSFDPGRDLNADGAAKGTIFMVCPIGARDSADRKRAEQVRKHVVQAAFPDYEINRSDIISEGGSISHQIVASIKEADLIVIDMSGHNPNVFYEMAIAHGFHKAVVHMIQDGERIPFDVKDLRALEYDLSDPDRVLEARDSMFELGTAAMASPTMIRTPLSQAEAFTRVYDDDDSQSMVLRTVVAQYEDLSSRLTALDRRVSRSVRTEGSSHASRSLAISKAHELEELIRTLDMPPAVMRDSLEAIEELRSDRPSMSAVRMADKAISFMNRTTHSTAAASKSDRHRLDLPGEEASDQL